MQNKTLITLLLFFSLGAKANFWTQKASFPLQGRSMPLCFSIGNNAYVYGGRTIASVNQNDLWEYNQPANIWTQKANFPGTARIWGTSFSIGNFGYMGMGLAGVYLSDFWQYDPATNTWTQKSNFGGGVRYFPVGFAASNKGYAGMGLNSASNYATDMWEYDPPTDTWTQKQNFAGTSRATNAAFAIGTKAYLGIGYIIGQPSSGFLDFWQYDLITDAWTQVANFAGSKRTQTATFAIGANGYLGVGNQLSPNIVLNDFWQYNPSLNTWSLKAPFGGTSRDEVAYCSINTKGYIGLGWQNGNNPFTDWWEYNPDSTTGTQELTVSGLEFTISPNPAKNFTVLSLDFPVQKNTTLTIFNALGKTVYTKQLSPQTSDLTLPTSSLAKGMYTLRIDDGKHIAVKKFMKE